MNINKELKIMLKNTYVLNKNDKTTTYMITTDTLHTRNRRQVRSTTVKSHRNTEVVENHLIPLSSWEAQVTMAAEQILRNKKAMSDNDKAIVAVARSIKEFYYNV